MPDPHGYCQKVDLAERDLAIVTVQVASHVATRTVRSRRVSLPEKLANVGKFCCSTFANVSVKKFDFFHVLLQGGIVGLFCGVSVLSLAEVAFWVARGVRAMLALPAKRRKNMDRWASVTA